MNKKIINNMSQNQIDALLSQKFPDVVDIMKKVREDKRIKKADKRMIEQQLISLCGSLHRANKYHLKLGVWRDRDVYSAERAVAANGPTIQNETLFTIVSCKKQLIWVVYIDLPIAV